jgi:hypothetical protein
MHCPTGAGHKRETPHQFDLGFGQLASVRLAAGRGWGYAAGRPHAGFWEHIMVEPQISLDPQSLNPVEEKLRGPLEEQLTSALRAAADNITEAYAGQSVDAVTAELLEQTKAGLHPDIAAGFTPDHAELHRVAAAIVQNATGSA